MTPAPDIAFLQRILASLIVAACCAGAVASAGIAWRQDAGELVAVADIVPDLAR